MTQQTKPKTPAQRQQLLRDRNRERGFKLAHVWIHPEDEAPIKRYIERLNRRRGA